MSPFKTAIVAYDAPKVPEWVIEKIREQDVDLAWRQCTDPDEVYETGRDADLIWVFGGPKVLSPALLQRFERCGVILRSGSGTDNIPVAEATRLGIIVANTPQATSETVSDHAIALMLIVARKIMQQTELIRKGTWDFRATEPPIRITGCTIGFIGFGHIPRRIVEKLRGFNTFFLAYDPFLDDDTFSAYGVQSVSLDELLVESDFVSVHCPLTEETFHLLDAPRLALMKKSAVLLNTSRGAVIDEEALIDALREGRLAGAGLDVVENPSKIAENPLLGFHNVVITPHMAGYSLNHLDLFWRYSVETVIDVANGFWPRSCVNADVIPRMKLRPNSEALGYQSPKTQSVEG